jgi:DMSO/TMAO reductase YedYZ molybdopterin-dependent catalytic subunit
VAAEARMNLVSTAHHSPPNLNKGKKAIIYWNFYVIRNGKQPPIKTQSKITNTLDGNYKRTGVRAT